MAKGKTGSEALAAVAQNPRTLGLGIDENTAVVIDSVLREGDSFALETRRPTSFGAIQHICTLEAAVAN
jgi:hypothetical protein